MSPSHQVITGSGLDPAASHSTRYFLPAESGSAGLMMLTSSGGNTMSRMRLADTGVEMLLLRASHLRTTPDNTIKVKHQIRVS